MKLDKDTTRTLAFLVFGGIAFYCLLEHLPAVFAALCWLAGLFQPLFIGFCIAFVLNVPMRFLERHVLVNTKRRALAALRRPLCIAISLVFILTVLSLIVVLVVPELLGALSVLGQMIPRFVDDALVFLRDWSQENADSLPTLQQWLADLSLDWGEVGRRLIEAVTAGAGSLLGGTVQVVSAIAGGITNGVIAFILALYMLLSKETLSKQLRAVVRAVLRPVTANRLERLVSLSARTFASFVTGQCCEACILGTLCWLGMTLLRLPYAPMIGALVGFTALIPIVGAFIGTIVGAFMIGMVDIVQAVWFVVFLLTLQQIEGNLIYPRVVGSSVGLPAMWVLIAVTIGGAVSGIGGMLFAVPVVSILYSLSRMYTEHLLKQKGVKYEDL